MIDQWYRPDGTGPISVGQFLAEGLTFGAEARVDYFEQTINDVSLSVSTVFLGLDHSWGDGPPRIFETMVFGGDFDGSMRRYATVEEARDGHREVVDLIVMAARYEEEAAHP